MKEAVLLLLEKEGKILFGRRAATRTSLPNKWSLPSETIEKGQTKEDAVKHCAKHELGLDVGTIELLEERPINKDGEEKVLYFFNVSYTGEPSIMAKEELTELESLSFKDFFAKYTDEQIGHGLQYLRKKLGFS